MEVTQQEVQERPVRSRRQTITPPPPALDWAQEVRALEEVGAELAIALWRVLRKVRTWADTPQEDRATLFELDRKGALERLGQACAYAPALVETFGTFASLVRAPHKMRPERLADACHEVHEWAEARSFIATALLFAEAAALADPHDAGRANVAGRMCRRAARDERSTSWFHRAFGLSVRAKSREEVIRALLGYGNLLKDLGRHGEALSYYETAASRAEHTGRRRQAAEAHHDLLTIAAEVGTFADAARHVLLALNLYPNSHPRLPALAHDWAFLLVRLNHYTAAIPLLEMAVARVQTPELKSLFVSTLAWAAAGIGQRERFDDAEQLVLKLVSRHEEYASAVFIHLAEGARIFESWGESMGYVKKAIDFARVRKDAAIEREGLELLEKIAARELAPADREPLEQDQVERITRRFEVRLRRWHAPGRKQPGAQAPWLNLTTDTMD